MVHMDVDDGTVEEATNKRNVLGSKGAQHGYEHFRRRTQDLSQTYQFTVIGVGIVDRVSLWRSYQRWAFGSRVSVIVQYWDH